MKVSLKTLNRYIDLSDISVEQIEEALPMLGLEVESVENTGLKQLDNVVVGQILSRDQHPNADKLGVCMVKVAEDKEAIQIVCGATNYKVLDKVPVALAGAKLPMADSSIFEIKVSQLRGVESNGMMCSARELGMGEDHSGLLILDNDISVGTKINDVFTNSDTVFDIELTANRGDCLSHIGVARDLSAKFSKKLKMPELNYKPDYSTSPENEILKSVEVLSSNCPLYTAVCIENVEVKESPEWLKNSLEAIGLRSINNVVDITNFVMMEYGQPLHAFDAKKLRGNKIIVRQALDGEKITTLDEKSYTLTSDCNLICDEEGAVAMAGIMGALNSEVGDDTKNIVLESAYFNPANVRASSRKYNINTDSSYRYARDVDPKGVLDASRRAVDLILELAGGNLVGKTCKVGEAPRADRKINITLEYIIDRLGFEVLESDVVKTFESLGFGVSKGSDSLDVLVPSFRSEVDRPIDLVEEFIRIWGSENIPERPINSIANLRNDDSLFKYNTLATNYLASKGLNECQNYTLKDSSKLEKMYPYIGTLKLDNPLTSDQDCLRPSLIEGLLESIKHNISNGNEVYGMFENGEVFWVDDNDEIYELSSTAFAIVADKSQRKWKNRELADLFTIKQMTADLLNILGINRLNFLEDNGSVWQEGYAIKAGRIKQEGFNIRLGALNISLLRDMGIDKVIYVAEIMFKTEVASRKKNKTTFAQFSNFPSSSRDIAIIVPSELKAGEVLQQVNRALKSVMKNADFEAESVELFDAYEGKGVEEGFKSLAFEIKFRSAKKTLQTEQINDVFDKLCQNISKTYKLRAI